MRPWDANRGFTLVEILVSMVIGLFLIAGMIQMYLANKQTYRFNEALSRMQENGRYAIERMGADLRMASFWGCSRGRNITNHVNTGSAGYNAVWHDFADGLGGRDSPGGSPGDPDEITIKGAVGNGFVVQGHGSATLPITVSGTQSAVETALCGYRDCLDNRVADLALVSNCKRGDIFQVTSLAAGAAAGTTAVGFSAAAPAGTPGNDGTPLSEVYDATATLHPLRVTTYCVSDSANCSDLVQIPGASGQRSLYVQENGATPREVVEGVENLQITYGEDLDDDGTANRYVSRASVGDMAHVVSVRVSLLLSSINDGITADAPQAFDLDGEAVTCPAGHVCQVMSSTFTLRNRAH